MGKALMYEQILLTNSSRKCMEISLENLHLDIGALELWAWELCSILEFSFYLLKRVKNWIQDGTQGVFALFQIRRWFQKNLNQNLNLKYFIRLHFILNST